MKTAGVSSWERLEDPGLFLEIEDLELAAHGIVEGALHGLHRSPFRGSGSDFDSHREYRPGDDLRYLDWNLYARHGRPFTKQFRAETNLNLYLLLDATASMAMRRGPATKFRYAARAAAALALLSRRTHDAAGVFLLRSGAPEGLSPSARRSHFHELIAFLESVQPKGTADFDAALDSALHTCRRRGIVVLFSDFLTGEQSILRGLRSLRQQGHEVMAFQVLDPWECELPATGDFEFADLESGELLRTSSPDIRESYAREVAAWRADLRHQCEADGIQWVSSTTAEPLGEIITHFLQRPERRQS